MSKLQKLSFFGRKGDSHENVHDQCNRITEKIRQFSFPVGLLKRPLLKNAVLKATLHGIITINVLGESLLYNDL